LLRPVTERSGDRLDSLAWMQLMTNRISLAALLASVLAIGAAYGSAFLPGGAPAWAAWAMAIGTAIMMVATTALGAARQGRIGTLWIPLAFVFLSVAGGFGWVLAMPATESPASTLWLGVPARAAIVLYGIGFLPLLVVPFAYALTFDQATLSEADLERVRAAAAGMRAAEMAPARSVEHVPTEAV
jgi:hypothetical protein